VKLNFLHLGSLLLWLSPSPAADFTYSIRDGGFAIHNGGAFYNRPLFGTHEPSMLMSGDQPAFAYLEPTGAGKIGNLLLGVVTPQGSRWLHDFSSVDSVYQPGLTWHVVSDPLLGGGVLEVGAVPLSMSEGFTVRLKWRRRPQQPVRLVWLFGGASGAGNGYRTPPLEKLHLGGEDAEGNRVRIWGDLFTLSAAGLKSRQLVGRCDLAGRLETKSIRASLASPAAADSAPPFTPGAAVFSGDWPSARDSVHLLFLMSGVADSEQLARDAAATFDQSVQHYRKLAATVRVNTPDPHFNLALESMVIANDGTWQHPAFLHGAVSWMIPYLGWRIWYGPEVLGFHDRVRSAIQAFASLQFQGGEFRGGIPHTLTSRGVYYDMHQVFLDQVYYHYRWTGDRALLASLLPVIEGLLAWEKQKLDPDNNALYESCLNTWISDSHWYNGGDTTQASAYMFRAYQLAAEAAQAAGKDPAPYREEAERIRRTMNDKLWLADRGHFAEFIDRIGLKRVHREPELPTIYHPIEFDVTDQFQAYQMLRFTETALKNERNIPNGGRMVWSSRWAPNTNENYTHSTYELAFAEELNLGLAYYHAGQFDQAYELIKGVYASMYQGAIPGGLPCHAYVNGGQRRNEEFADAISMFARAAVEGVFGIMPDMPRQVIHVSPGFPSTWNQASIATPDISYTFAKSGSELTLAATTARDAAIHYRVPLPDAVTAEAWIDGARVDARLESGVGRSFLNVTGPRGRRSSLTVRWASQPVVLRAPAMVAVAESLTIAATGAAIRDFRDPQKLLGQVRLEPHALSGIAVAAPGHHTIFVLTNNWRPVNIEVRAPFEILNAQVTGDGGCRFRLRNNTARALNRSLRVAWAGATRAVDVTVAAGGAESEIVVAGNPSAILPGPNRLALQGLIAAEVQYWPEQPPPATRAAPWRYLPLDARFNDSLATVLLRKFWTTEVPYAVCRDYSIDHLNSFGVRNRIPDDGLLRQGVDSRGVFTTHYGIPFAQPRQGNNMVALSRWPEFSPSLRVPVNGFARRIYLLLSTQAFPMQSHIANARVKIQYEDGGESFLDLENPRNFDNGWGEFAGTWHYSENGVELLSSQGRPQVPFAATILEQHETWKPVYQDFNKLEERPHADIVGLACDPRRRIRSIDFEVLSQDIIVGLFGLTLLE
jgi:hypothetical protein